MQNYGLVRRGAGNVVLEAIPMPSLADDYILVRTVTLALNPTDWTSLEAAGKDGSLIGCDYAGIVEKIGKAVKRDLKKGDRVSGFAHGENDANPENGAFARYIAVKGDIQLRIPENLNFESASTIGIGIDTVGLGLFKVLGLSLPGETSAQQDAGRSILIYGGSTATGTLAIQLAKLAGWKVITTCSPKHNDLVKGRGADLIFDYREPGVGAAIRKATGNTLIRVFDTVSTTSTASICADAMSTDQEGIYCNLLGVDCPLPNVKSVFFLVYSMSGESYIYEGDHMAARPEDLTFGSKYTLVAEKLWAEGKIEPHPQQLEGGGLLGIIEGMKEMKAGKVSGVKLIYRIDETSWPE